MAADCRCSTAFVGQHGRDQEVAPIFRDALVVLRRPAGFFDALNECSAFVNWRRIAVGEPAILVLSYWRTAPSAASDGT